MRLTKNIGMLLLGIYLILVGLDTFVKIPIAQFGLLLGLLALIAGILILVGR